MKKRYSLSLFIFRRDLRLDDNTGLLTAIKQSDQVLPCFIVDPRQVGSQNNYRSLNALQFMCESLKELSKEVERKSGHLYLFYGKAENVVKKLLNTLEIQAVFCNRDYTSFSLKRDEVLQKICFKYGIDFNQSNDLLLHEPELVKSKNGTPYLKFTPFFNTAQKLTITKTSPLRYFPSFTTKIAFEEQDILSSLIVTENRFLHSKGGTTEGLKLLKALATLKHYERTKDFPSYQTSNLSAHLKFGTISIRQTYYSIVHHLGAYHPLIRQLYWRDFFTHIAYNSPFVFGQTFTKKYNNLVWKNNKEDFRKWCQGKTGFPLVDAGMRQLIKTGFMHNRVRMVAASFLIKDLHIDWRWGEHYFAQQLVDYDPAVNNGNWQWVASTGADAQPYFRIFNPWLQQKKYDPECLYIKEWIPELKDYKPSLLHQWYKAHKTIKSSYPAPMIDHARESIKTKSAYTNA